MKYKIYERIIENEIIINIHVYTNRDDDQINYIWGRNGLIKNISYLRLVFKHARSLSATIYI